MGKNKTSSLYFASNVQLVRMIRSSLPKESIPSFCFGRVMGLTCYSENGMESWPITKTRGFKIGSDASLCNVVIDYNNADPVHLILVNEPDIAMTIRNNKRKKSTLSQSGSTLSSLSSSASATSMGRSGSSRSRASAINNSGNDSSTAAVSSATLDSSSQPPAAISREENSMQPPADAMELDTAMTLNDAQSSQPAISAQGEAAMQVDNPTSNGLEASLTNDAPLASSQQPCLVDRHERKLAHDETANPPLLSTNHLENKWYIQVVGRTGVYINNFYHGCVNSKDAGSDLGTSHSTSSGDSAVLVPVQSGDELRVGDWIGKVYFS